MYDFFAEIQFSTYRVGGYVAIFPSFRLEKHFYREKLLPVLKADMTFFEYRQKSHTFRVKMYVENEKIRKKSYSFFKIPPGGIPFRLILHPFLLLFRRLSPASSAKAPVSSSSLSVLFSPWLCYTTLLDVRIGCQNRISSLNIKNEYHYQMSK